LCLAGSPPSLLATAAYIDLNPLAAGSVPTPEAAESTSLRTRIDHAHADGTLEAASIEAAGTGMMTTPTPGIGPAPAPVLWLLPTDDRRGRPGGRPGLASGLILGRYLRIVDCAARPVRDGKARMAPEAATILERLRIDAPTWRETVSRLLLAKRPAGSHPGSPARLDEAARAHGRRWHRNPFRRIEHPAHPAA
jgi:hypothetical protein